VVGERRERIVVDFDPSAVERSPRRAADGSTLPEGSGRVTAAWGEDERVKLRRVYRAREARRTALW